MLISRGLDLHDDYLERSNNQPIKIFDIPIADMSSEELVAAIYVMEANYYHLKLECGRV